MHGTGQYIEVRNSLVILVPSPPFESRIKQRWNRTTLIPTQSGKGGWEQTKRIRCRPPAVHPLLRRFLDQSSASQNPGFFFLPAGRRRQV